MNRLTEYDRVTLSVPFAAWQNRTIEAFDARVLAIVGPTAALESQQDFKSLWLPDRVEGAMLSFRHERAWSA